MSFIALLLMGTIAWSRIPLEMMPSGFELKMMWVWVPYTDATPRETERQVTHVVEEHLATVPGIHFTGVLQVKIDATFRST